MSAPHDETADSAQRREAERDDLHSMQAMIVMQAAELRDLQAAASALCGAIRLYGCHEPRSRTLAPVSVCLKTLDAMLVDYDPTPS